MVEDQRWRWHTSSNRHAEKDWWDVGKEPDGQHCKGLAEGCAGKEEREDEAASEAGEHGQADSEQLHESNQHIQPPRVLSLRACKADHQQLGDADKHVQAPCNLPVCTSGRW